MTDTPGRRETFAWMVTPVAQIARAGGWSGLSAGERKAAIVDKCKEMWPQDAAFYVEHFQSVEKHGLWPELLTYCDEWAARE